MPRSFGEPLTKLRAVPIQDNGELLLDPRTLSRRIHFAEKHPKFEGMSRTPKVRQGIAERLAQAAGALPNGLDLIIIEGFRPLAQQRFMYEQIKAEFARKHPEWSKATLHRITNTLSAPPDDPCPPPHTTGGAVDLSLIRIKSGEIKSGEWLDMTSPFEMDETSAPGDTPGLSDEAQANRRLLFEALKPTGLTNYLGEWWHWSYGDSGWALRVGAKTALYDRLPEE